MNDECINCRFCFKLFELFEDAYIITDEIKQIYEDLTCTELVPFIVQKSFSCQKCLTLLQAVNVVKKQFIANQELHMTVDRFECETTMEIDDVILEQYITTPERAKKGMVQVINPEETTSVESENPTKKHKLDSSSSDSSYTPSPEAKKATKVKVRQQQADTSDLGQCYICFRRMKDVKTHCFHYHKHEMPTCDKCGKTFFKKESLEQHMYNQYLRRRFPCQYCPKNNRKSYLTKGSLRLHIKIMHQKCPNQQ